MVYSSYVLLLHVLYLSHAHNLFLQTAIEQGIPGLLAFIWLTWVGLRVLAATLGGALVVLAAVRP